MSRTTIGFLAAAAVTLFALVATGCSSSTLTQEEYAAEMNALCLANEAAGEEIGEPEGLAEVATMVPQFSAALSETLDDMAQLEPPDEIADEADEFVALGRQSSALLNDLATAAGDNDSAAFDALIGQIEQLGSESNEIANSLGATACTTGG